MIEESSKTTSITRDTVFVILSLLIIFIGTFEFSYYVQKDSFAPNLVALGLLVFMTAFVSAYLIYNRYSIFSNRFWVFLVPILLLISCMLLFVSGSVLGLALYMISGVVLAKYINKYFGLFILFELMFFSHIITEYSVSTTIFHIILGTFVCVLFPYVKTILTGLYVMVVEVAIGIILYFVLQLFPHVDTTSIQLFPLLLSFVFLIVVCGLFSFVYYKTTESIHVDVQALLSAYEETTESITNTVRKPSSNETETKLEAIKEITHKTDDTEHSEPEKNKEERVIENEQFTEENMVETADSETEKRNDFDNLETEKSDEEQLEHLEEENHVETESPTEVEKNKEDAQLSLEENETNESTKAV